MDQLAEMSSIYQEALAAAASNAERARLAEWDAGLLRGQIGLTQQDLARVSDDLTTSLAQARPRRSIEGEHSGEALNFGPFQPAGDEPC